MARRHYNLPSLTSLAVFEAAGRARNFKAASRELNVMPGAVSHQIKALETELGVPLFVRAHRGVEFTEAGRVLFETLSQSFHATAETVERLRRQAREPAAVIGASTAVAALWLMPRISAFWRENPDVRVNHRVSDAAADLKGSDIDLVVQYGDEDWPDHEKALLFCDDIVPVASPALAVRHRRLAPHALAAAPLIQLKTAYPGWTTWREWFAAIGVAVERLEGPEFNNYTIALQAAEDGAGVILGWRKLIAPLIERGRLEPLQDAPVVPSTSAFLLWRKDAPLAPEAERLRDWLLGSSISLD